METLYQLDLKLFHFINRDLTNPLFDVFFPWWTDVQKTPLFLFVFLPLLILFLIVKKHYRALKVIVAAVLVAWAVNSLNHHVIKGIFTRPRPIATILRIESPGSPSFPSGHSIYIFCLATLFALFYPRHKILFFVLAGLTAFSRVYCGVHYPSDVFIGGVLGMVLGYIFFRLLQVKFFRLHFMLVFLLLPLHSFAWDDPTGGKPFFPWVWEDQLKPTFKKAGDKTSLAILGSGAAATLTVRQYDDKIFEDNHNHPYVFTKSRATELGGLGDGPLGVGIAAIQIFFDQQNGLKHARALILTSVSTVGMSALVRRERPDDKSEFLPWKSSFPSGHTASAFATAGSLAYSYGWMAGIPAYAIATGIGISRIRVERHWASDIIAGMFIGSYWARASFRAEDNDEQSAFVVPTPVDDGLMLSYVKFF